MLTNHLRPKKWSDVAGQKINVSILKAIIKTPSESPKSIIMEGAWGSGKTSLARIMAREINDIKDENYDINMSSFYYEYDSTVIGNVEDIKKLKDTFNIGVGDYWKIIVFDEMHSVSTQAQTALLKILEEVSQKTIFILCTTHVHKVLPTIRSRSLELNFGTVSELEIVEHLNDIEVKIGKVIPNDIKGLIADRSYGHMRDVHMLLNKYLLIGEDTFRASVYSSIQLFCDLFIAFRKEDSDKEVENILTRIYSIPLEDLKNDFNKFINLLLKSVNQMSVHEPKIHAVVQIYKVEGVMKLVKHYFSEWVRMMFVSEYHLANGLLVFYSMLKKVDSKKDTTIVSETVR
jgi:DNA polymerase III gamma/tau subunit